MSLPRIQYITHPDENFSDLSWIDNLCKGGVRWIQLRIKENHFLVRNPESDYLSFFSSTLKKVKAKCDELGILLTVNDQYKTGLKEDVDGFHVGKEDEKHNIVREYIGHSKILGATANNLKDIESYNLSLLDYLGVGPFQFTTTKDKNKLAPVLGARGYRFILTQLNNKQITTPIYAIGGIKLEDISIIMNTGVYGIALSGLIFHQQHDIDWINKICNKVEDGKVENR